MFARRYRLRERQPALRRPLLLILVACVGLLLVAGVAVQWYYRQNLQPVGGSEVKTVTVAQGASVSEIGKLLKTKDLIRSEAVFAWYVRSKNAGEQIQAGTYQLQGSLGIPEIVSILTQGQVATDLVTILPGQRLAQIKTTLIQNGFAEDEVNEALKPTQYADHPALADMPAGATLEGFLFPESFQRTDSTTAAEIVTQSLDEMQAQLTPALRTAFASHGLSIYQAVTLASIVMNEASCDTELTVCQTIAQVFLKRLEVGMTLGSDVTACYGAIAAGVMEPDENCNDYVGYDSAYNTRIYKGLPPGPISNVTAAALEAVAHPTDTDWLYFVAGDDDITYFSRTLEEHEALVAEHCREKCQ